MYEELLSPVHAVIHPATVIASVLRLHRIDVQHWRPSGKIHPNSTIQLGSDLVSGRGKRVAGVDRVDRISQVARTVPHHQRYVRLVPMTGADVARQAHRIALDRLVLADACQKKESEINNHHCTKIDSAGRVVPCCLVQKASQLPRAVRANQTDQRCNLVWA